MPKLRIILAFAVVLLLNLKSSDCIGGIIRITKFEHCDPIYDYPLKISVKIRTMKKEQYLTYNGTYTIPFAYNATIDVLIAVSKDGKTFLHIFSLHDTDVCRFQRKYLGEFYYKILENSGVNRNTCPLPSGQYIGRNMKVDYGGIPLEALPNGIVRIRQMVTSQITRKILSCVDLLIKHQ